MGLTTGTDRRARPAVRVPWALSLAIGTGCAVLGIVLAIVVTLVIHYLFVNELYVPLPWGLLAPVRW